MADYCDSSKSSRLFAYIGPAVSRVRRVRTRYEDAREQSTMIDGCESGRAFVAAAAAAFTCSDL